MESFKSLHHSCKVFTNFLNIAMKLLTLLLFLFFSVSSIVFAQSGSLRGNVVDKDTQAPLPFVKIKLIQNEKLIGGAYSDIDGRYIISAIPAGTYNLHISYVGYSDVQIEGIKIMNDKITFVDVEMDAATQQIDEIMIMESPAKTRKVHRINSIRITGGLPDSYNTEEYNHIQDNQFKKVKKNPLSTFSIDVDRASYSNVRRYLTDGMLPPKDAVRIEEMINYFNYDYPAPTGNDPFSISAEYTDCPWNRDHKLVHIGLKGKEINMKNAPANNLVFLIDVSGSMNSPDKLGLLKSGLYLLVDQLREKDQVAIVVYASASGLVLPSISGNNKDQIKSVIEQLDAGGSTAGGEGIKLAYKVAKENFIADGNNRVILVTDGDFNVGVSSESGLIRLIEEKREDDIFLTVLGFGSGNLKDSKMEQLADKGNGNYSYIDNILEAKKVLVSEMGGTLVTIAKDVKIQAEFNPKLVKAYRLVGYVNRLLNDEDFNDDTKDAGELGSGHTVTALYEIIPAGSPEEVREVDPLKYQSEPSDEKSDKYADEILTVKFRYKEPKGTKSKLISHVVHDLATPFEAASENCQFSAAVATFGMLLRDSEFKGDADYQKVIAWAIAAKGKDDEGYRAELIRFAEMAELLSK